MKDLSLHGIHKADCRLMLGDFQFNVGNPVEWFWTELNNGSERLFCIVFYLDSKNREVAIKKLNDLGVDTYKIHDFQIVGDFYLDSEHLVMSVNFRGYAHSMGIFDFFIAEKTIGINK